MRHFKHERSRVAHVDFSHTQYIISWVKLGKISVNYWGG